MTTTKKAAAKKASASPRTCKARGCKEAVHVRGSSWIGRVVKPE